MLRTLLLALTLTACTIQSVPPKASGQSPRYAIMDDYVRERLAKDWRAAQIGDGIQLERAYCLRWQLDIWAGEPAYRVTQIDSALVDHATPGSISFHCPREPDVAQLHVHPPHTCVTLMGPCWKSGPYGWQCLPSDQDQRWLNQSGDEFSLIQCDEHAVIAFFPRPHG